MLVGTVVETYVHIFRPSGTLILMGQNDILAISYGFFYILLSLPRIVQPMSFCLIQDSDYTDIAARISIRRETLYNL